MKSQEANLTGLGHCIFTTDFLADPEPISVIMQASNELPMNEIVPIAVIVENNALDIPTLVVPPAMMMVIPTTAPALLIIDIPSTEKPIHTVEPDTLHFVSLENTTDEVDVVPQFPMLPIVEKETIETVAVNASSHASSAKDVTTGIPDSNELLSDPLPAVVSYVPESAPNWTNVAQPLPVEPPPPEPILTDEDII